MKMQYQVIINFTKEFTIPTDAVNFAVIIYPTEEGDVYQLKLKQFQLDVDPPFNGYIVNEPEVLGESHLIYSDTYKRFNSQNINFNWMQFNVSNFPTPILPGVAFAGNAPIRAVGNELSPDPHAEHGRLVFDKERKSNYKYYYKSTLGK